MYVFFFCKQKTENSSINRDNILTCDSKFNARKTQCSQHLHSSFMQLVRVALYD